MILTKRKQDWGKFVELLEAKVNFRKDYKGVTEWNCKNDFTFTEKILKEKFPKYNLLETLDYFEKNGGYCDCEILLNIEEGI